MIINISDPRYSNYKIIDFPSGEKVIGVRAIDSEKLEAQIFNYSIEELEIKLLNTFGIDEEKRLVYLQFV